MGISVLKPVKKYWKLTEKLTLKFPLTGTEYFAYKSVPSVESIKRLTIIEATSWAASLKTLEKIRFCCFVFVFSKRKTKRQVSASYFWFENETEDFVLSNRFQK